MSDCCHAEIRAVIDGCHAEIKAVIECCHAENRAVIDCCHAEIKGVIDVGCTNVKLNKLMKYNRFNLISPFQSYFTFQLCKLNELF